MENHTEYFPLSVEHKIYACAPSANTLNLNAPEIRRENVLELNSEHVSLLKAYDALNREEQCIALDFINVRAEKNKAARAPRLQIVKSGFPLVKKRAGNND